MWNLVVDFSHFHLPTNEPIDDMVFPVVKDYYGSINDNNIPK